MPIFALPNSSTLDQAASCFSVSRSHTIRHTNTHTHTHTHTAGMTPLNERTACHRRRYLNNTQQTQEKNIHALGGIRTQIPALQRRQTYGLDRTDTGIGLKYLYGLRYWQRYESKPPRMNERTNECHNILIACANLCIPCKWCTQPFATWGGTGYSGPLALTV
jgi:hypothetical protein